jgi:hypothetical protein
LPPVRIRLALAAFLLAALFVPQVAQSSPYVRYGVQDDAWIRSGPGTLEERLGELDGLGVRLVRLNLLWSEVEKPRGTYDWDGYDRVVNGLHEHGIETVLTLFSTPPWANGGRGTNVAPLRGADFARFARQAALRYPFVRRWLVWNEPNQRRWLQPTSPSVYVKRLLNPAYVAIHRAHRNALVAGGITAPRGSKGGVSPVAWIRGMAAAHARLDAYGHNPYPLDRRDTPFTGGCDHCETISLATIERLLAEVKKSFGARTRVWLTEFGYQTSPPDPWLGVSWGKQAVYVGEAALRAYLAPRVDMLINFLVRDEPEIGRWQSGVLTVGGRRKPSYNAMRIPLAVRSHEGLRTALWGQVRLGQGVRRYSLEKRVNGRWRPIGKPRSTDRSGFFNLDVRAGAGTRFRVVEHTTGLPSYPVVVR